MINLLKQEEKIINPVLIKIAISEGIKVATDEEKRNKAILIIVIFITILLMTVLIPIYLILNPIDTIKLIITDDTILGIITDFKTEYNVLNSGELTYKGKFPFPLENADATVITSTYGIRIHPITGVETKHRGIDFSGVHHDNIIAIADGIITFAGIQSGYGNCIEIKHNIDGEEFFSFYAHLSKINVERNQEVLQGNIIALEGGDPNTDANAGTSTGHHLHFEIRTKSGSGNDIDPTPYIL